MGMAAIRIGVAERGGRAVWGVGVPDVDDGVAMGEQDEIASETRSQSLGPSGIVESPDVGTPNGLEMSRPASQG